MKTKENIRKENDSSAILIILNRFSYIASYHLTGISKLVATFSKKHNQLCDRMDYGDISIYTCDITKVQGFAFKWETYIPSLFARFLIRANTKQITLVS